MSRPLSIIHYSLFTVRRLSSLLSPPSLSFDFAPCPRTMRDSPRIYWLNADDAHEHRAHMETLLGTSAATSVRVPVKGAYSHFLGNTVRAQQQTYAPQQDQAHYLALSSPLHSSLVNALISRALTCPKNDGIKEYHAQRQVQKGRPR